MSPGNYLPDGNPASSTAADDAREHELERELRAEYAECAIVAQSPSMEGGDQNEQSQVVKPSSFDAFCGWVTNHLACDGSLLLERFS